MNFNEINSALGVGAVLIGGLSWFVRVESRSKRSSDEIISMKIKIETLEQDKNHLGDRMARIETKIDFIVQTLKENK